MHLFRFPSPHSGILFLWYDQPQLEYEDAEHVSVPSFGDSFFMTLKEFAKDLENGVFPSPHSGILFL